MIVVCTVPFKLAIWT